MTWYLDRDDDGHGDPDQPLLACEAPPAYVASADDCADDDALTWPGASEGCDSVDNDCDGVVDDGAEEQTFYEDSDGDGYGDGAAEVSACAAPEGYTDDDSDCDDSDDGTHPGAGEELDGGDDDCNGEADDLSAARDAVLLSGATSEQRAGSTLLWADLEMDGELDLLVGAPGRASGADDCAVYVVSSELLNDALSLGDTRTIDFGAGTQCGSAMAVDEEEGLLLVGARARREGW